MVLLNDSGPKKDGGPRRTADLQNLHAATKRETHHIPSLFGDVSTVPPGKKKLFMMPGMGIIAYLYPQRYTTLLYLSQNEADIDIHEPLKAYKHPTMATQSDLMILQKVSLA